MTTRKGPNLQNFPIRTPEGKRIRDLFCPLGGPIMDVDYAELEREVSGPVDIDNDPIYGTQARRLAQGETHVEE